MNKKYDDDILDVDMTDTNIGYDDILDDDLLDDVSWDDPKPKGSQPRKAMKSGKSVKGGKKMPLFNVVLIGGAILVGLALLLFQFSGGSTPAPQPVTDLPMAMAPIDPNAPTMPTQPNPNDIAGLQAQQDLQQANPQIPEPTLAPTAENPTGGILNDPSLMPEVQAQPQPQPQLPSQVTPQVTPPATDIVTTPPTNIPPAILPSEPATSVITEVPPSLAPSAPAPTVTAPIADTVTAPKLEPKPEEGTTTIATKELEDLRATVASLQSKVQELESKPSIVSLNSQSEEVQTPAKKAVSNTKKKTPAKKASSTTKKKSTSSASSAKWELRGIAGGEAVVSRANSDEFKTIGVGDNLSGVGRVTSIENQNGAWVITGTEGRIRQ